MVTIPGLTQGRIVQNISTFLDLGQRGQMGWTGSVQTLELRTHLDKPYLHFADDQRTCTTIMVTHWNEEDCQELEVGDIFLFYKVV